MLVSYWYVKHITPTVRKFVDTPLNLQRSKHAVCFFIALLVSKLASKVADILNSAHEESGSQSTDDDGPLLLQVVSSNGM